jgi:type IV fimbrial biogenesis protein FimT
MRGYTLLELLLTVTLLASAIGFAVPTMSTMAERRQTMGAVERIYSELQLARSAAVATSQPVFMNISSGTNWAVGVSDNSACDPVDNDPVCSIPDVDGNNAITYRFSVADNDNVQVDANNAQIIFSSQRGTATPANITVTSLGDAGYIVNIIVRPLGQIAICSPIADPARHLTSYRECA